MRTFSFEVDFGYGPKVSNSAVFNLELNEQEIAFIKNYLRENGEFCGYGEIELENSALFDKINDAANDAVVAEINRDSEVDVGFDDVDWMGMSFDFIWPDELVE